MVALQALSTCMGINSLQIEGVVPFCSSLSLPLVVIV